MATAMVFERYEKKYLLTKQQYETLRKKWENRIVDDDYGKSTICNIYYDTKDYDLISTSLEKPLYKEKIRLRSYGIPKLDSIVYLELKKKVNGKVYKRRCSLTLQEAKEFIAHPDTFPCDTQIKKELRFFLQHHTLTNQEYIAYDRIAAYDCQDKDLRITFDLHIRSRDTKCDLEAGDFGEELMDKNYVLMEIKIKDAMPLWLAKDLNALSIYPTSFSKYGNVYKKKKIRLMNTLQPTMQQERNLQLCSTLY